jgi:hypothetical protein
VKAPKTMHELTEALSYIMAGAINGDVKETEGRLALNAATRIIEAVQAETRVRALAFATNQKISPVFSLTAPVWPEQPTATQIEQSPNRP